MSTFELVILTIALLFWVALMISFEMDRSRYRNCFFLFFALISTVMALIFLANGYERDVLVGVTPVGVAVVASASGSSLRLPDLRKCDAVCRGCGSELLRSNSAGA